MGIDNNPNLSHFNESGLVVSVNIAIHRGNCIPRKNKYRLFFVSYYTNLEFFPCLAKEKIQSLGCVNKNHLAKNCKSRSWKTEYTWYVSYQTEGDNARCYTWYVIQKKILLDFYYFSYSLEHKWNCTVSAGINVHCSVKLKTLHV